MSRERTGKLLRFACRDICCCLIAMVLLLAACAQGGGEMSIEKEATAVFTPSPSITPTSRVTAVLVAQEVGRATAVGAADTPTPILPTPSATPRLLPTTTHYTLWAALDLSQHYLTVTQTITYVNKSLVTHAELPLLVEPARLPNVFHLQTIETSRQTPLNYVWQEDHLVVTLPAPLSPGDYVGLRLSYTLSLPAQASDFGYTPRQINLGNWYPMVPPYRTGRGWMMNQPGKLGEHLAYDRADYDVYLQVLSADPMPALAASGIGQMAGGDWLRYWLPDARNFSWSVGDYVTESTISNGVRVTAYTFPEDAAAGTAVLEASAQALALFSDLFAPYPHQTLVIVAADFPEGMEFDGLYFLDQGLYKRYNGTPREYLVPIAVHETAHQWWQGIVGSDQALEPWLDEALATYSELLFYEVHYPELVDWWWHFRVNRFAPTGWVDSDIYEFESYRAYINSVYLRGAMLLHEMREVVGDELFLTFLRAYTQTGTQTGQLTASDFWRVWCHTTQADVSENLSRYFAAPGDSQPDSSANATFSGRCQPVSPHSLSNVGE